MNVQLVGQIGGGASAVAVQGHYACVGVGGSLHILDASTPASPTQVGQTGVLAMSVGGVAVRGRYAYVAGWERGPRIVDLSDPAGPTVAGDCDTPGYAEDVGVAGHFA